MYPNHRLLPFFSRLDDGRVLEQEQPGAAALVAGADQSDQAQDDPLLLELSSAALSLPAGAVVIAETGEAWTIIDPPSGGGLAIIGLMCPPTTVAVAASVQCTTLWLDGERRAGRLAWSLTQQGGSMALFREQHGEDLKILSSPAGTLLDAALRALGLDTPRCLSPTVWFPDGVFLHRLARLVNQRGGLGTRHPLNWKSLSAIYPLNNTGEPLSSCLTRHLRQEFYENNTWSSLRRRAAELPASEPAILPGLTPAVADWLDDGSFARWVLSRVSDVPSTLAWLCEHVDDDLAKDLSLALGEVRGTAGAAQ